MKATQPYSRHACFSWDLGTICQGGFNAIAIVSFTIVVTLVEKYSTRIMKYAIKVDEAMGMERKSNHCI